MVIVADGQSAGVTRDNKVVEILYICICLRIECLLLVR